MRLLHLAMAEFGFVGMTGVGMTGTARAADADEALYVVTYVDVMPTARAAASTAIRAYRAAVAFDHRGAGAIAYRAAALNHPLPRVYRGLAAEAQ